MAAAKTIQITGGALTEIDPSTDSGEFLSLGLGAAAPAQQGALSIADTAGTSAYIEATDGASAAVSAANHGRLRYNESANQWEASENGGAYQALVNSGGGWTDDGTVVRLTDATDTVAIGAATMAGGEKVRVVGELRVEGALTQTIGQVSFGGNVDCSSSLDVTGNVTVADSVGTAAHVDLTDGDSAAVSAANHGRLRYNESTDKIEKSENAGSYAPVNAPDATIVDDATTTTTTSTTDTQMANMTATPAAGTYAVHFSGSLSHSTNNTASYISIYSGGTQVAASERAYRRGNQDIHIPFHAMAIVTVNGAQAIQGQWRTDAGTLSAHERQLMHTRVA